MLDRIAHGFHNTGSSNPKKGVRILCIAACLIAASITARAQDCSVVVDGPDEAAIQSVLDALVGPCVVVIPPGRYQIEGTLLIRGDDVTLLGSGSQNTVLFRETDGTNTSMVSAIGRQRVRISGIGFEGVLLPDSNGREVGVLLENAGSFRVDHAYFTHLGFAGVRTNGSSSGVVDHCVFEDQFKTGVPAGYGVVVYGTDQLTGIPFGSDQATFIEDCTFSRCRHAVASNKAARYVFRFNYITQNVVAHAIDAHGTEGDSVQVGTEWIDAHDNVVDAPNYVGYAVRIRGGAGLVWNNRFEGYNLGVELTQYTPQTTGPVYIWNNMIIPATSPMVRARCMPDGCDPPVYFLEPPLNYTPYPYPHPLVVP